MSFADEMRKRTKDVRAEAAKTKDKAIINKEYENIDQFIRNQAENGLFGAGVRIYYEEDDFYIPEDGTYDIMGVMNIEEGAEIVKQHYKAEGFTVTGEYGHLHISWK